LIRSNSRPRSSAAACPIPSGHPGVPIRSRARLRTDGGRPLSWQGAGSRGHRCGPVWAIRVGRLGLRDRDLLTFPWVVDPGCGTVAAVVHGGGRSRRSGPFLDSCLLCRRRGGGQGGVPAAQRGEPTLMPTPATMTIGRRGMVLRSRSCVARPGHRERPRWPARPGRFGHSPPRVSMAIPMSASGLW
jgi:hypothetical protein